MTHPRTITTDLDLWDGEHMAPFTVVAEINPGCRPMRGVDPGEPPFIQALFIDASGDGDLEPIEAYVPIASVVEALDEIHELMALESMR